MHKLQLPYILVFAQFFYSITQAALSGMLSGFVDNKFRCSLTLFVANAGPCNYANNEITVADGQLCEVSGVGNVVQKITLGQNSEVRILTGGKLIMGTSLTLQSSQSFTLLDNAIFHCDQDFIVQGQLTLYDRTIVSVVGNMMIQTTSYIYGRGSFSAENLVLDGNAMLDGTGKTDIPPYTAGTPGLDSTVGSYHTGFGVPEFDSIPSHVYYYGDVLTGLGSIREPSLPGSRGASQGGVNGPNGGSAIELDVRDVLTLRGIVDTSAQPCLAAPSCGSGGSVLIRTRHLKDEGGSIHANGGVSVSVGTASGGSGGRISLLCEDTDTYNLDPATIPFNLDISAKGAGQGAGTIWYDCGAVRSTLQIDENWIYNDPNHGGITYVFVNVAEFENRIIREIRGPKQTVIAFVPPQQHQGDNYVVLLGSVVSLSAASPVTLEYYYQGKLVLTAVPDATDYGCFDFDVEASCIYKTPDYAEVKGRHVLYGPEIIELPRIARIMDWLVSRSDEVTLETVERIMIKDRFEVTSSTLTLDNMVIESGAVASFLVPELTITDTLLIRKYGTLFAMPQIFRLMTNDLLMESNSEIAVSASDMCVTPTDPLLANYAGCSSTGCGVNSQAPTHAYDAAEFPPGRTTGCQLGASLPGSAVITVTGIASLAGKIHTTAYNPAHSTSGGGIRLILNEIRHFSGKVSANGKYGPDGVGGSGGRIHISCTSDPYHSILHAKTSADGACTPAMRCGATGTVYINCGYYEDYLRVVSSHSAVAIVQPTHIILESDKYLRTLQVDDHGSIHLVGNVKKAVRELTIDKVIGEVGPLVTKNKQVRLRIKFPRSSFSFPTLNAAITNGQMQTIAQNSGTVQQQYDIKSSEFDIRSLDFVTAVDNTATNAILYDICLKKQEYCEVEGCVPEIDTPYGRGQDTYRNVQIGLSSTSQATKRVAEESLLSALTNYFRMAPSDVTFLDKVPNDPQRMMYISMKVRSNVFEIPIDRIIKTNNRIESTPPHVCFRQYNT